MKEVKALKEVEIKLVYTFELHYDFTTNSIEKSEKVAEYASNVVVGKGIRCCCNRGGAYWNPVIELEGPDKDAVTLAANKIVTRLKRFKDSKIYE